MSDFACQILIKTQAVAMEVVVTEEKKKIFRARKTMKISDRQQLDSLHGTLLTAGPSMSDTSPPPPLVNGTHKEDGPKAGDREQNNTSDSNSPRATSPVSPTPFLSLNLSPSPAKDPAAKIKEEKPSCPKSTTSVSSLPCPSSSRPASSSKDLKQDKEVKVGDNKEEKGAKKGSISEEKMEVDSTKKEKEEKGTTSGLKRTLSEGFEKDGQTVKREGKRPKVERQELEAKLEFKFTAKAGGHHKLEKIVQQLVDERLKVLELTIFDKHFQELKERVDKIDSAPKHQTAITITVQAKINRLTKKFGEANQASENKRKQEVRNAATAAAAKTVTVTNRVKEHKMSHSETCLLLSPSVNPSMSVPISSLAHTPTSSAMVSQAPILQLITTTSNAGSNLATGITTQSPTGTLLLKTASGSSLMAGGQPLLIQLPLSMTNGQGGTLVNFPVSSLSAGGSLGKAKTTTTTTTFILKPAPAITTSPISLTRAVFQGGAGGITTPNAGVSVTTARMPAQSVSVAGALSSASSPATSGPAATGSAAPGPPQGTSLTSKTDNQATGSTPSKAAASAGRPKGSVIDLTEDDDDVQGKGEGHLFSPPHIIKKKKDSSLKPRPVATATPTRSSSVVLPPLPAVPTLSRIPPEAERSSPPQQPQLKLVPSQTGIVLSWCVTETDRTCAAVDSYHLYAFHQDNSNTSAAQQHWKKIGEVNALPLPMACTLTQFQSGSTYHFAVRAKDIYGRFGSFCEPQCTNVINSSSS
uniref:Activating transcription factor 7 interacting protein n=1 Tax=Cyclopterus lumpus TaxID=8103 RepID=A0A8C2WIT0_CYCLU